MTDFILINTVKRLNIVIYNKDLNKKQIVYFVLHYDLCNIIDTYTELYDWFIYKTLTNMYREFMMRKWKLNNDINLINPINKKLKLCVDIRYLIVQYM